MKNWLIKFKIIDHYSDRASNTEVTIVPAETKETALDYFYFGLVGETIFVESIEEMK